MLASQRKPAVSNEIPCWEADVRQIYEMHAAGASVRTIARKLGMARYSVRMLRAPEVPKPICLTRGACG